jgi:hypothetical protein
MTGISRTAGGQWMSLSLCSCIIFSFGLLLLFPLSNLVIVIFFFFPLSASYGFFFFLVYFLCTWRLLTLYNDNLIIYKKVCDLIPY